jgi:hypothetical protein
MVDLAQVDPDVVDPMRYDYENQITAPAGAAIVKGTPVYLAAGRVQPADASAAGTLGVKGRRGVAIEGAEVAGLPVSFITEGLVWLGDVIAGLDDGDEVHASDTVGRYADATGTAPWVVGVVTVLPLSVAGEKVLQVLGN